MQGSTPLATLARRVRRELDEEAEAELDEQLKRWQEGGPRERRALGDPGTIVLESEMVRRACSSYVMMMRRHPA